MEDCHADRYTEDELAVVDAIMNEVMLGEMAIEMAYQENCSTTQAPIQEQYTTPTSTSTHHYVGGLTCLGTPPSHLSFSGICDSFMAEYLEQNFSTLAPLQDASKLKIPSKVNRAIERYIHRSELKKIHPDHEVARELCLIFLNNLSTTFHCGRWKHLYSVILKRQVSFTSDNTYAAIVRLLSKGTAKHGPILLVQNSYGPGMSKQYALSDAYFSKGIVPYNLKTEYAIKLRNREHYRLHAEAADNPIARNLFRMYSEIKPPMKEEIQAEANTLIANGYRSKKGKLLTRLNGHRKSRWKDHEARMFVEDCVEIYEMYTDGGYLMPVVTDAKAGGRVVDSFTLMPSWIRNMTTVNGQRLVEVDYAALHPNIASSVYGGQSKYITHRGIAEMAGIDPATVKVEHLSLFNKRWDDMQKSTLLGYYMATDMDMMMGIYWDKLENGYKSTPRRLFAREVALMSKVIEELNAEGIYVLYVYDAVLCERKHKDRVITIMNNAAVSMGIHTTAK